MMNPKTRERLKGLIEKYDNVMGVMEHNAAKSVREDSRAYGGFVRAAKGKMQEYITDELIRITWVDELSKDSCRLEINSNKIKIPIKMEYVNCIRDKGIKDYILSNIRRYYYGLSVDKHVFIDEKMVLGIECKAYAENAMIKRILVDFYLLKTRIPDLTCYLFQLESMLGGDYCEIVRSPKGSSSTHTLMSYFRNVDLKIVTLLSGERKVDRPINKHQFSKSLTIDRLGAAVESLISGFRESKVL